MQLFAPLTRSQADEAERGRLRGDFLWFDTVRAADEYKDAVWVMIDVPDRRMPKYEQSSRADPGQREYMLPARMSNLHGPRRV